MSLDQTTSEPKFTPGPWRFNPMLGGIMGECVGGCRMVHDGFMVAQVRGWGHLQYRDDGEQVQDANGRLLAAAPDLYAACEAIIHWYDDDHDTLQNNYEVKHKAIELVRAALAKAVEVSA